MLQMDQTLHRISDTLNVLLAQMGQRLGGGAGGQGGAGHTAEMYSLPTYEQLTIPSVTISKEESS